MSETVRTDICIIGGGAAGLAVAMGATAFGAPVVLIEKGAFGGDHLHYGSIATNVMTNAANLAEAMRRAPTLGLAAGAPTIDLATIHARIKTAIATLKAGCNEARLPAMNMRVVRGAARFVSPTTVEAGELRIEARRFVIATGSSPVIPAVPGLEYVRTLTNETVFDLRELPSRLLVLGEGGYALTLAQAYRRFGSEVCVVSDGALLDDIDADMRDVLLGELAREGIDLRPDTPIAEFEPDGAGAKALLRNGEALTASHVLIAGARAPNVHNLGLEQAGVAFTRAGIAVGRNFRTDNRRIHAIGDVIAAGSASAARQQAGALLRHLLARQRATDTPSLVPRVIGTEPAFAAIGLSESEALAADAKLRIYRWPLAETEAAATGPATVGHLKAMVARNGRVLGACILAPRAGDLIAPWQLAVAKRLSIEDMAALGAHAPGFAELTQRAALQHVVAKARNPLAQSLMGLLRRLG